MTSMKKYINKETVMNVLGMDIDVKFMANVITNDGQRVAGLFEYSDLLNKYVIKVNVGKCKTKRDIITVVLHEVCHAAFYRLGLHNTDITLNLEEIIVDGIATVLAENFDFNF